MSMILAMLKKHRDIILYLIFGALTTLVNYAVYLPLYNCLGWSAGVCNLVAWIAAVAVAFLTNKPFVFASHDWSAGVVWKELVSFFGCRVGSGVLETLILLIAVDRMHLNGNLWKIITSILVVILNYFGSKLLVFTKK